MIVGIVSAKGSPGVTTLALALTAVAGPEGLLVELDPSGGSIECWTGSAGEPGLVPAASALRRSTDAEAVIAEAAEVVPGIRALLAPTSGELAEATVGAASERLLGALATPEAVVVDCGRWSASQRTGRRVAGCNVVIVLCSPTIAGVEAARWLIGPMRSASRAPVALATVGDRPYSMSEIAPLVDADVVGSVAWDPRGANSLVCHGVTRAWQRTPLARSAASLLRAVSSPADRELVGGD